MGALELEQIRELLRDLEGLVGVPTFLPSAPASSRPLLEQPEQLQELLKDLLVDLLGMEVQGL